MISIVDHKYLQNNFEPAIQKFFEINLNIDNYKYNSDKVYKLFFASLKKGFASIDISDCPDLGPVLFVVAALNHGGEFTGAKRLKIKESNRLNSMINELSKIGVDISLAGTSVVIKGKASYKVERVLFDTYNDHRIAMALCILGMFIDGQVIIENIECVNKSYPDFIKDLESLKQWN